MVSGSKNNCTPDKIRRRQRRKWSTDWKKLRIDNDFIFCKVMQDKSLLTELIHLILPDLPFKELNIITQKSEEIGLDIHGIRLDVHARDEYGNLYDLEMQNRKMGHGDIPKRLRYYGSVTDANMLDRKKQ